MEFHKVLYLDYFPWCNIIREPLGDSHMQKRQNIAFFDGNWHIYVMTKWQYSLCIGHMAHMFLSCLNYSAGCPSHGDVISTWICMCLLRNWTAEGMLAWDWRSSGIMRKASLFVGPPRHRDLTLWAWPVLGEGIVLHFPTSFLLSRAVTHQRGGRKWLFIDEHAQELVEEESQSAGYNCLSWSRAIPQQPAWMLQSDSLPPPAARSTNLSAP